MTVPDEIGESAVRRARAAIERALGPRFGENPPSDQPAWTRPSGAFVTLRTYPEGALRGCIGFPLPIHPLSRAIDLAAVAAATEDPRFRPVTHGELDAVTVEVSLLTRPEPVPGASAAERERAIVIGRDGLIVSGYGTSGLLLPQVAVEEGFDAPTFLAAACEKAGLVPNAWKRSATRVERFSASVFAEAAPRGAVVRAMSTPSEPTGGPLAH